MRIIFDIHGKMHRYKQLTTDVKKSVQIGDLGFKSQHEWFLANMDCDNHKVLFGNHDYYPYINLKHSLGDFAFYEGIFFIRGAASIDKAYRVAYRDWFPEEELNFRQMTECFNLYSEIKPKIVVSHDCPQAVCKELFGHPGSHTRNFLQLLFEEHQPDMWLFGHHHQNVELVLDNTYFKCGEELEYYDISENLLK